ncbi:MurR/RpiR family transcriptional regulator [Weissella diestrammenae]|uniref:MurR/RpiR family transcriptional regulator n=1 Tax=Weissella diestrammenae TaxID=1162633 RepID=A0A7G9T3K9_9LACO|nr:MurR/RpiR family transcriptional regulator [Weissella diestrammenae]MCM0582658.1 MurR/RpiR family transcriptional regulator [Weissella diestrammenae]QNN74684.1 MurR/RpiR family transcriptional regulator [Weissella diestrammenae]
MDSLLARLADESNFTKGEQKIATYLIKNHVEALKLTAEELGKVTGTSGAATVRFAKKMGYRGLPSLKLDLASEMASTNFEDLSEITKGESVNAIFGKMGTRFKLIPDAIQQRNSDVTIERVIDKIESAERIFVYGIAASSLIAQDLQQKFMRIGLSVIFNPDFHQMVTTLQALGKKGDLAISISESGKTPEILLFQKISQELQLTTVALTSDKNSSLAKRCDLALFSFSQIFSNVRSASTTGLASQFFLVDILFYSYLSRNFDDGIAHVLNTRNRIDGELRHLDK